MRKRYGFYKRLAIALVLAAVASSLSALADTTDPVIQLLFPAPDQLQATGLGPDTIVVAWLDHDHLESAFELEWSLTPNDPASWSPATQNPITHDACTKDNTGLPYVNSGNPGDPLNQYADQNPPRCSVVLGFLRNHDNSANVTIPYAASVATHVWWFRVRGIFPDEIGNPAPGQKPIPLPPGVRGLVHSTWSNIDPAIVGPKPPTGVQLVPSTPFVTVVWNNAAAGDPAFSGNAVLRKDTGSQLPEAQIELPATSSAYFDGPLTYDHTYRYRVVAERSLAIPTPPDPNTGVDGDPNHVETAFSASSDASAGLLFIMPPVPAPGDPIGLVATFIAPSTANLTWFDTSTDEDGFLVEFGPDGTHWIAQTALGPHQGTGYVTFSQFGIPPDTVRYYRVFAYRVTPYAKSGPSNSANIVSIPKAPSNLTQTSVSSFQAKLSFVDNSKLEDGFRVEFCDPALFTCPATGAGNGWTPAGLALPPSSPVSATGQTISFTDARFASTTLKYRAVAFNASGSSDPSNVVSSTTPAPSLNAPSNLVATADNANPHKISLSWTDTTNNDDGQPNTADDQEEAFRIEYADPGLPFLTLTAVGAHTGNGAVTFDDLTAKAMTTRCYRVRSVIASQSRVSDPSNKSCAHTVSGPKPPAPSDLVAQPWDCNPRFVWATDPHTGDPVQVQACNWTQVVRLTWTDNSPGNANPNEDVFVIEESLDAQTWSVVGTAVQNSVTTILARHFEPSTIHYFRMKAVNTNGESAYSNIAQVHLLGPPRVTWLNPSKDNQVATSACSVDGSFVTGYNPPVTDVSVQIVRKGPLDSGTYTCGSTPGSCKWDPNDTFPEFPQDSANQVQLNWNGTGTFKLNFHFRKNITYELHARAINADGASADAYIPTFVVAADCPLG